jgi:hypothetical protein
MALPLHMPDTLGTPIRPLTVKCTSLGQPSITSAYISAVLDDGRQMCVSMSRRQWALLNAQIAQALAAWPEDVQEPAA